MRDDITYLTLTANSWRLRLFVAPATKLQCNEMKLWNRLLASSRNKIFDCTIQQIIIAATNSIDYTIMRTEMLILFTFYQHPKDARPNNKRRRILKVHKKYCYSERSKLTQKSTWYRHHIFKVQLLYRSLNLQKFHAHYTVQFSGGMDRPFIQI